MTRGHHESLCRLRRLVAVCDMTAAVAARGGDPPSTSTSGTTQMMMMMRLRSWGQPRRLLPRVRSAVTSLRKASNWSWPIA